VRRRDQRDDGHADHARDHQRHGTGTRRARAGVAENGKRGATPDQERRQAPAGDGLLDVQSLEEVQHAGDDKDQSGQPPGAAASADEVDAQNRERHAGRERERVRGHRNLLRHELQEQLHPGLHPGRERRGDVDEPHADGAGAGDWGETMAAPARA
jgi:hypothetical protein